MSKKVKNENLSNGLDVFTETTETAKTVSNESKTENQFAYENLKNLNASDFHTAQYVSSKFEGPEREARIKQGIELLKQLPKDFQINPLLLNLAEWWEVKPARAEIKKAIDQEAKDKGQLENEYLQVTLKSEVEKLVALQTLVDRLRYAITYFKPREGREPKGKVVNVKIGKDVVSIYQKVLERIKIEHADNRDAMIAAVKENAIKNDDVMEL